MLPYAPEAEAWAAPEWTAHGLPCAIIQQPRGHFCGYVGVPVEHPAHGFGAYVSDIAFDDIPRWPHRRWRVQQQLNSLSLTYAQGNRENLHWWFGTDWLGQDPALERVIFVIEALAESLRRIK